MTFTLPTQKINEGTLVKVELYGLPGSQAMNVFTYRAHADVRVGELVLVPAPEWSIKVTQYDELPGRVLGTASSDDLPADATLRDTMPLRSPEGNGDGLPVAEVDKTIARWRRQAQGLSAVAGHIAAAADELEKVRGQ